ncbi:MAG: hypothetical protein ACE5HO_16980 [bacterium]
MVRIAYYEAPPETLESSDEMQRWAESAYATALRAAQKSGQQ